MTSEPERAGQGLRLSDQGGIASPHRRGAICISIAVILSLLNVVLILWFRFLPMYDYSIWLYETKILRELSNHLFPYHEYFEVIKSPVPNLAFTVFTWALSWLVSYETAGKIFLSLCVVGFPWSVWYAIRRLSGNANSSLAYIGFPFSFNLFMFGGHNYIFGAALLFWTLGYFVPRLEKFSSSDYVLLTFALLIIYFTHIIPYGLAVCFLLAVTLFSRTPTSEKRMKMLFVMVPSIAALVWYFLTAPLKAEVSGWSLVTLDRSLFKPLCLFVKSYGIRSVLPLTIMNALWLLVLLIMVVELLRKSWSGKLWDKRFLLPLFVCAVLTLLLPDHFLGIFQPGARFMFLFFFLLVLMIRVDLRSRWTHIFLFVAIAVVVYDGYFFSRVDQESAALFTDLVENVEFKEPVYVLGLDWPAQTSAWDKGSASVNFLGLVPYYAYLENDGVAWIHETGILRLRDKWRDYAPTLQGETVSQLGSSFVGNIKTLKFFRFIVIVGGNEVADNVALHLKMLGYYAVTVNKLWSIYRFRE